MLSNVAGSAPPGSCISIARGYSIGFARFQFMFLESELSRVKRSATEVDKSTKPGVSVVIPVYNSALILPELTTRLATDLAPLRQFEIVLINDGSLDGSWNVIAELATRHDWVRGINLMRNCGLPVSNQ